MISGSLKPGTLLGRCVLSRAIVRSNRCSAKPAGLNDSRWTQERTFFLSSTIFQDVKEVPKVQRVSSFYDRYVFPEPPDLISEEEHDKVISKVNTIMEDPGRLFAVVTLSGQQYKVTANDIISINGRIPAECGEKIRLEKVSLVGGSEFTLLGRPILPRNLVKIEATVIEKTPSVDIIIKRFRRRQRYERTYKFNSLHSLLRINCIEVSPNLE